MRTIRVGSRATLTLAALAAGVFFATPAPAQPTPAGDPPPPKPAPGQQAAPQTMKPVDPAGQTETRATTDLALPPKGQDPLVAALASQAGGLTPDSKNRAETVFRRGLRWAQGAYPEPHTEVEAANYDAGRRADRDLFVRILGYDPGSG